MHHRQTREHEVTFQVKLNSGWSEGYWTFAKTNEAMLTDTVVQKLSQWISKPALHSAAWWKRRMNLASLRIGHSPVTLTELAERWGL
jgi:hypothetical protein